MSASRLALFALAFCLAVSAMPAAAQQPATPLGAAPLPSALQAAPGGLPEVVPTEAMPAVPDIAPVVPPGDRGVAQKLQDLIGTRLSEFIARKPEQAAVEAFYRERGFQPLWTSNGAPNARASQLRDYLQNVGGEGLDPKDYPTPDLSVTWTQDDAAANELKLTRSALTYARHASSGRVSFTRVSASILYPEHAVAPEQVLAQLATAQDVPATLAAFEPQHPAFKALQAELAKVLAAPARVEEPSRRGEGKPTREARHGRADLVGLITANMERWRWLPRDLGANHVIVDVPDYSLAVFSGGNPIWRTKIVVGKPNLSTPLLSETMKYLTINPTWNVPPSIIRNEYLPALQRDPGALDRIGLKVGRNPDGSIRVYQPPGSRNALGRIRFNFPNVFLVYQHDTPNKNLFARETRAFSHGCMRVQNPEKYAEVLLSLSQPQDGITAQRISSYYGDEERTIKLARPIPVHITYQTALVDEAGRLKTRDDIYDLDAAVLKLMRGNERAIADVPIARNYQSSSKPVMANLPERSPLDARASASNAFAEDRGGRWQHWGNDRGSMNRIFDRALGFW